MIMYGIILSIMLLAPCINAHNEKEETRVTLTHADRMREQMLSYMNEEDSEPDYKQMAQLGLSGRDMTLHFGGKLKDDLFFYNRVNTLRTDYNDQNDFIRHKFNLNFLFTQGAQKYDKPASQGFVRLTNYVLWQKESNYTPLFIDTLTLEGLEDVTAARNVRVKSIVPLVWVEQAWFNLNFDTFTNVFKDKPTSLKVGYFPYTIGRGVAMGYHADMAVEHLGWNSQGGYTRYPFMPPGILFRTSFNEHLSWDVYFNLWTESNASLSDTLLATRQSRLVGQPERGKGKDRITWSTRLDYTHATKHAGDFLVQPYSIYVDAPEQTIEVAADASSKLFTPGLMMDWKMNGWHVNIECAGQFGHQHVHAIDRNEVVLTRSGDTGSLGNAFSHIFANDTVGNPVRNFDRVKASQTQVPAPTNNPNIFQPHDYVLTHINTQEARDLSQQGEQIRGVQLAGPVEIFNANIFGNARFRPEYTLAYRGFMGLCDVDYTFDKFPLKLGACIGYISGDNYPYNDETTHRSVGTFVPLRSRYRGGSVQSVMVFDRLLIPRPLNISNRTLYAFNNTNDLSNLEFIGLGATWYPCTHKEKCSVTTDLMFFWEATTLKKWDKNGKHPDPAIEAQLVRLRNTIGGNGEATLFKGWLSTQNASSHLGTEFDVKVKYQVLDHCTLFAKAACFIPGQLYRDLDGQPNDVTRRTDESGLQRYDSLGHDTALAGVLGLNYVF